MYTLRVVILGVLFLFELLIVCDDMGRRSYMKILVVVLVSLICGCMPISINNIDFVSEQQVNSNLNAVADTGCELKRIIRNTNECEVIDKGYEIKNLAIYNENLYYVLCDGDNHTEGIIKHNKNSLKR